MSATSVFANDTERWIYRSPTSGTPRLRLFCLPYAGAGAAVYRLWPQAMPEGVELCRLQPPGRESRLRDKPFDRLDTLVEALVEVVRPDLDRPFALFGHSMGALVAFELARALRREAGVTPVHLFVSAWRAPDVDNKPHYRDWPEADFIAESRRRFGGIPDAVLAHRELLDLFVPLLRADLAVCESYIYRDDARLDCPISAFWGRGDGWVREEHLGGWADQTRAPFEIRALPGDHFFVDSDREALLAVVVKHLQRAVEQSEEVP